MRRRHLESVSVRSTDDASASFVSSTASDRKGFVKGESVPLDRILVPFVRTKGTPPRRAVFTMPLQKAPRRRQARRNYYLLLSIPQSALRLTAPFTQGGFGVLAFTARNTPHSTMTLPLFRSARSSRIMTMASATGSLVWAPVVMFLQDTMPAAISSSPKNST